MKRRNVVRVAVAYAIVGWILVEVTSTVLPIFEAPDWIVQVFTFFIILGFPLALILSWAYEITPEGIKLERNVTAGESITKVTGRQLDFVIIGVLVIAVALFTVDRFVLDTAGPFAGGDIDPASLDVELDEPPSATAARTPAIAEEEQREVLPNSVAVLPFENLSPDPDNAYYAAGIHEEILNQLAKLSALNVIARTSVRQYANTEKSIPEIARELNIETVMEGSLRYDAGRIRITVQLNDGVTGAHIWSETYTRDFNDIFAIESDVAMNVANALAAKFSLAEQENIEKVLTESPEAYSLYLRAISGFSGSSFDIDIDRAIELDPNFALAYATKAYRAAYDVLGIFGANPGAAAEFERSARENAERALDLDPTLGTAYAALAALHTAHWRGVEAEEAFQRAVQLSPKNADVLLEYGRFKRYRGESEEAIQFHRRSVALDPNNSTRHYHLGISYRFAKNYDAAVAAFQRNLELNPTGLASLLNLARSEAARGNQAEAVRAISLVESLTEEIELSAFRLSQLATAYAQLGRRDDVLRLFHELEEMEAQEPAGDAIWAKVYLALGDAEQALQRLESAVQTRVPTDVATLAEMATNTLGNPILDRSEFRELLDELWDSE